ncbi:OsmC family protein [Pseudomonas sp. HLT2-19-2]
MFDSLVARRTAKVHTTGGWDGASRSDDGRLEVKLSSPGTKGDGTNPEQLFATGWSACFSGAMQVAAGKMKVTLPPDLAIDARSWRNFARRSAKSQRAHFAEAFALVRSAECSCGAGRRARGHLQTITQDLEIVGTLGN